MVSNDSESTNSLKAQDSHSFYVHRKSVVTKDDVIAELQTTVDDDGVAHPSRLSEAGKALILRLVNGYNYDWLPNPKITERGVDPHGEFPLCCIELEGQKPFLPPARQTSALQPCNSRFCVCERRLIDRTDGVFAEAEDESNAHIRLDRCNKCRKNWIHRKCARTFDGFEPQRFCGWCTGREPPRSHPVVTAPLVSDPGTPWEYRWQCCPVLGCPKRIKLSVEVPFPAERHYATRQVKLNKSKIRIRNHCVSDHDTFVLYEAARRVDFVPESTLEYYVTVPVCAAVLIAHVISSPKDKLEIRPIPDFQDQNDVFIVVKAFLQTLSARVSSTGMTDILRNIYDPYLNKHKDEKYRLEKTFKRKVRKLAGKIIDEILEGVRRVEGNVGDEKRAPEHFARRPVIQELEREVMQSIQSGFAGHTLPDDFEFAERFTGTIVTRWRSFALLMLRGKARDNLEDQAESNVLEDPMNEEAYEW